VDTEHHLIVAHQVTNNGSDRSRLSSGSSLIGMVGVDVCIPVVRSYIGFSGFPAALVDALVLVEALVLRREE
jgi:hypothetical protein